MKTETIKSDLFGSSKQKEKTKKGKDHLTIDIDGPQAENIVRYVEVDEEIKDLTTEKTMLAGEIKPFLKEQHFCRLYKENKRNPDTFLIHAITENRETLIQFQPRDEYISIDATRAAELRNKYGEDCVTTTRKFIFNNDVLERNREAISTLIMECSAITEEDKANLIEQFDRAGSNARRDKRNDRPVLFIRRRQ